MPEPTLLWATKKKWDLQLEPRSAGAWHPELRRNQTSQGIAELLSEFDWHTHDPAKLHWLSPGDSNSCRFERFPRQPVAICQINAFNEGQRLRMRTLVHAISDRFYVLELSRTLY